MSQLPHPVVAFSETSVMALDAFSAWIVVKEVEAFLNYIEEKHNSALAGILMVASMHASSQTLVYTNLKEVLDGRKDAHSIPKVLDIVDQSEVDPFFNECRTRIASMCGVINKIGLLRGHVFGHRSLKMNAAEAYEKANLKPSEVDAAFDEIRSILIAISDRLGIKGLADDFRAHGRVRSYTVKMLGALSPKYIEHREKLEPALDPFVLSS